MVSEDFLVELVDGSEDVFDAAGSDFFIFSEDAQVGVYVGHLFLNFLLGSFGGVLFLGFKGVRDLFDNLGEIFFLLFLFV